MHPSISPNDPRNLDVAKYMDKIAEVSNGLAELMPNVRCLNHDRASSNSIAKLLYGQLAGHYADQLQCLNSRYPIAVPLDRPFLKLRDTLIDHDLEEDYQVPRMASGELVTMTLANGATNHLWAPFSASSESRVIEFTKLKTLCASYCTIYKANGAVVHHRDGHPWELHFPSLKSISVSSKRGTCPLLEYAVLPPRMESISIELSSTAFCITGDIELPETNSLSLTVLSHSFNGPSGLPVINRILERARGCESLELFYRERDLHVAPEEITCTALTRLLIASPAPVDTMLALIEKLPRLTRLTFDKLLNENIQRDISIPEADEDAVVEPLSTSLKVLGINYNIYEHLPDIAVAVAKYLLLRIPTLTQLFAAQTPKDGVHGFVQSYSACYPRLGAVELKLYEGRGSANLRF
ncbi:hypothetical protein H4R19_000288 [Coemansia spiralis]|nr:hypothetical protein H4R19_000288 [Coemansia spiralis]